PSCPLISSTSPPDALPISDASKRRSELRGSGVPLLPPPLERDRGRMAGDLRPGRRRRDSRGGDRRVRQHSPGLGPVAPATEPQEDRKSTRLNSSHVKSSYA